MTASPSTVWAAIVLVGVGTYALRVSGLVRRRGETPPGVERALRFVPPAILAALVLPAIVVVDGTPTVVGNERLLAGAIAGLVAWRTEDILATILAGVGALLALGVLL